MTAEIDWTYEKLIDDIKERGIPGESSNEPFIRFVLHIRQDSYQYKEALYYNLQSAIAGYELITGESVNEAGYFYEPMRGQAYLFGFIPLKECNYRARRAWGVKAAQNSIPSWLLRRVVRWKWIPERELSMAKELA